jgi:hypothetical protein
MQIDQEKFRTINGRIAVDLFDELDGLLPVRDNVKVTGNRSVFERHSYELDIGRVVLSQQNIVRRTGCRDHVEFLTLIGWRQFRFLNARKTISMSPHDD